MEIIYIISALLLLINFILIKKTEKQIDIVGFIVISIVLLFCYNTFICYILTFFTISIHLWLLAIINIVFSIFLIIQIIRKGEIQKFLFNKIDILYIFIIIFVLLLVAYKNFGFPLNVSYISADPSHHYLTSVKFAKESTLMPNAEFDEVYGNVSVRKPASYVNSGILMKCFCKDLDTIECYNFFAGFGIFTFVLIGIAIYSALKKYATKKEHTFWAFLVALICSLGYPLNSLLYGFEYLTMGLLVLSAIIDLVYYYERNILKFGYLVLMFGLLNFGMFCSYYMFIPFVYPALWIYFCIKNYNDTKKIISKPLITMLTVTLLIPFILGYIYHLAPNIYAIIINQNLDIDKMWNFSKYIAEDGIATDGFIYINLYSNMLLLLPLTIYFFVRIAKDNKLKEEIFLILIFIFIVGFIEILFIGNNIGKVSIYYLSKNYFALWIIFAFTNYKALISLSQKNEILPRIFIIIYIILMIVCTIFSKVKVVELTVNKDENIFTVMEIFGHNKTILFYKTSEYNQDELKIINYAKNNLNYNSNIEIVADNRTYYWSYVLMDYVYKEEEDKDKYGGQKFLEKKWLKIKEDGINKEQIDYVIYFKKSDTYNNLKEDLFKKSEIIYENEAGGILKYNK